MTEQYLPQNLSVTNQMTSVYLVFSADGFEDEINQAIDYLAEILYPEFLLTAASYKDRGDNRWDKAITGAIDTAKFVLFVETDDAWQTPHVYEELIYAIKNGKPIIAISLLDKSIGTLTGKLWSLFNAKDVKLFDEQNLAELLREKLVDSPPRTVEYKSVLDHIEEKQRRFQIQKLCDKHENWVYPPFHQITSTLSAKLDARSSFEQRYRLDDQVVGFSQLLKASKQEQKLVLLGEPGSGKSTTLQRIMHTLAIQYRDGTNSIIPHFVDLKDIDQQDTDALSNQAIQELIKPRRNALYSSEHNLLLILDGLEEVSSKLTSKIIDVLKSIDTQFVVTSRQPLLSKLGANTKEVVVESPTQDDTEIFLSNYLQAPYYSELARALYDDNGVQSPIDHNLFRLYMAAHVYKAKLNELPKYRTYQELTHKYVELCFNKANYKYKAYPNIDTFNAVLGELAGKMTLDSSGASLSLELAFQTIQETRFPNRDRAFSDQECCDILEFAELSKIIGLKGNQIHFKHSVIKEYYATNQFNVICANESLLKTLMEDTSKAIWICDKDFIVKDWSRGAEEIYKCKKKDIINHRFDFVPQAQLSQAYEDLQKTIRLGQVYENFLVNDQTNEGSVKLMANDYPIDYKEDEARYRLQLEISSRMD
jgi:PAS domain-containing protein